MKRRIVHLIGSNCIGGPEKQILHHAVAMADSPYQMEIGSFHDQSEYPEILRGAEERNIPTVCLPGGVRLDLVAALIDVLRARPGVLLCTHGFKANVVGYFAARRTKTTHVAFLRGWTAENMRIILYEKMERYALSRAPLVVCVSQKQAEQVARLRKSRSKPIVVPNAMLPPWSRPMERDSVTRAALGIPEEAFVFGSVGRLSVEKGHRFMISAFREVSATLKSGSLLELIVVGDGREQEPLERQAREMGIRDRVRFAGFQGNPGEWMKLFDCLIQPSLTEGTPNAVLEAMCLGVPVIATAVGGVPDLIADGVNGLLVPPRDAASLAATMRRAVLDPELCVRISRAAEATAGVYSPEAQQRKLMAVYERAFGEGAKIPA